VSTAGLAAAQTDADFKGKSISINIGGWEVLRLNLA
jgi:hypothetical protein